MIPYALPRCRTDVKSMPRDISVPVRLCVDDEPVHQRTTNTIYVSNFFEHKHPTTITSIHRTTVH